MNYKSTLPILYAFTIIILLYYIVSSVREVFENLVMMDEAHCMECMTFYQDVFQYTDPAEIVPYIQRRTEFLVYVLRQFQDFIQFSYKKCIATIPEAQVKVSDMMACFTKVVDEFQRECREGKQNAESECAVIQVLGDQIIRQSLMCGANECKVDEFRTRFLSEVESLAQRLRACAKGFENDTSLCAKMYARIMLMKNQKMTGDAQDDSAPVTQKQLKDKLGEMTAFVMMNGT